MKKKALRRTIFSGTLAQAAAQEGECFLATGDRDALQLVSDHVTVLLAATKMGRPETTVFDVAAIHEKYGLSPAQLIDLKALMGDSSDNIPASPASGKKRRSICFTASAASTPFIGIWKRWIFETASVRSLHPGGKARISAGIWAPSAVKPRSIPR